MDLFENLFLIKECEDNELDDRTCEICGHRLTDGGECPVCNDYPDVEESEIYNDGDKNVESINLKEDTHATLNDYRTSIEVKAKEFAKKVDALSNVISNDEVRNFLRNLSDDFYMDAPYINGRSYPSIIDGYFSKDIRYMDLEDEDDKAELELVDDSLSEFNDKINNKIKEIIKELKDDISDLEKIL